MDKKFTKRILLESHSKAGIFFAAIFYFSFFFGTLSILSPYFSIWEKKSRHFKIRKALPEIDSPVKSELQNNDWPSSGITITFPGVKDPALSISHRFATPVYYNPDTGEKLENEGYGIENFFIDLHIGRFLGKAGIYLFGIGATGFIFLILNGHILSFFLKSTHLLKKRRNLKNFHSVLAIWISPFIFIIILSASFMGLIADVGGGLSYFASNGKKSNVRAVLGGVLFSRDNAVKQLNEKTRMISLNKLYQKALKDFPEIEITGAKIDRWGDKSAYVSFYGPHKNKKIITGWANRLSIKYSLFNGSILKKDSMEDIHIVKKIMSGFYFFHFLSDSGAVLRSVLFILCSAFCISTTLSVLSWCKRRENQKAKAYSGFIISRFLIAFFIGIIPSTAFFILLYWILPQNLTDRLIWLKASFFLGWPATLIWTFGCLDREKCIKGILTFSGALFLIIPLLHGFNTGFFPWKSCLEGIWTPFILDLGFIFSGILLIYLFTDNNILKKQGV